MSTSARAPRGPGAKYPTKAKISYLVEAAKAAGIKVGGVECSRDGTVRILSEARAAANINAYDDWKASQGA